MSFVAKLAKEYLKGLELQEQEKQRYEMQLIQSLRTASFISLSPRST